MGDHRNNFCMSGNNCFEFEDFGFNAFHDEDRDVPLKLDTDAAGVITANALNSSLSSQRAREMNTGAPSSPPPLPSSSSPSSSSEQQAQGIRNTIKVDILSGKGAKGIAEGKEAPAAVAAAAANVATTTGDIVDVASVSHCSPRISVLK